MSEAGVDPSSARQRGFLDRHKFGLLLASLVVLLLVPVVRDAPQTGRSGLFFGLALLAAINAVWGKRHITWIFALVGLVVFGGRLATVLGIEGRFQNPVEAGTFATGAVFITMMIYAVFGAVARAPRISQDTILGAICVYLLIGLLWTDLYALAYLADNNAFNFPSYAEPGRGSLVPEYTFGYYSFVTLTTLGYGDITPISFRARTLSWMEAVVGVTYMATVIAFLVSQMIADRRATGGRPDEAPSGERSDGTLDG